ncbi:MAG: sulfotransferase family 2 domain-containing protein [Rhodomicrobium sp.]
MLYQPAPLDFSRQILVFVHIPKAAGSTLDEALFAHFGKDACQYAGLENIWKIHSSRTGKAVWTAWNNARTAGRRLRGIDPGVKDRLRLLTGHFRLGAEPRTGRTPIYLTLIRDPVDRLLSQYYYRHDARAHSKGKRDRHEYWLYDIDRFADYVYARREWNEMNLQCRYLSGENNFAAARRAVDERVFLAAPTHRMNEFLALLGPVLGLDSFAAARSNIGRTRQGKTPPPEKALAKIREMVSEDQRLFDYVSRAFDDLYAKSGQKTPAE